MQVIGLCRRPGATKASVEHVEFDIAVPGVATEIARQVAPCEVIVHAAASLEKDLFAASVSLTNCLGAQEMLKLAATWRSYFVFTSSVPVIGMPRQLPITEDHPVSPPSAYHASKLYGEHLVRLAAGQGLVGAALRLTAPIGIGMPPNRILSVFVRQAISSKPIQLAGRGTRCQDYVDARDIAIAVEQCLAIRASGTYNIGSGRAISNEELAHKCISLVQSRSAVEFNGKEDPEEGWKWEVSIERASKVLGYKPRFSLDDSVQDLASEYARCNN